MQTREQIQSDIEQRFGLVPAMFETMLRTAPLDELEAVWRETLASWSGIEPGQLSARRFGEDTRLLALGADVGVALTTREDLRSMLQGCAQALVTHLDAAFARVWLLDEAGTTLELEASAGLYTHLDGPHGRVPVGQFKIGRIAESREPHLTNDVLTDPNVSDHAWAAREGMIAFAGYPLLIGDTLIGVVALFARHILSEQTLRALGSVADEIAIGARRRQTEIVLKHNEDELRSLFDTMAQGVVYQNAEGRILSANPAAQRILALSLDEMQGREPIDPRWRLMREDGSPARPEELSAIQALRTGRAQSDTVVGIFAPATEETQWISVTSTPMFRAGEAKPYQVCSIIEDITRRKQLEQEQRALLDAARARAEREGLINRVSLEIRAKTDPAEIQAITVRLLAEALAVDRCYYCHYDFDGDTITVTQEWHRPDLAAMAGNLVLRGAETVFENYYGDRLTRVISDSDEFAFAPQIQSLNHAYRIRARLSVALPSEKRGIVPTLNVSMADRTRQWTPEEVHLVETIAALTRSAMESARLQQRERNIATQLQRALQPDVPESVPGLALARYYQAALEEAGVGGDFYDVFPVDKGCTALVVGDLSGKGLDAASQVATVRNMLRAVLYLGVTVSDAIGTLNQLLATHSLLTGFTTLFVGMFDSAGAERTLTYVNCGQDPALILRAASGAIEQLGPTGTVLGTFENAVFTQSAVLLQPGDVLAIFTDGLTEAGPDRKHLLGIGGVAALLRESVAAARPAATAASAYPDPALAASELVRRVQSYAAQGARDDMCLLLGVIDGVLDGSGGVRPSGANTM